ncbi:MAG: penicillin-binding protein 1C [Desulfobulbus sp.]|nr:penicillin-binding protein 1C [Desulfobulbus sp.]
MFAAALLCCLHFIPADPLAGNIPCSHLIRSADGVVLRLTLAWDGQYRLWTPLVDIAPQTVEALLLKEDQSFFSHPGVNPVSLLRAAWSTYIMHQRQGGSTLTMQLARRLHRLNTRTFGGKFKQIALALWLEARHSKKEILEAYCNLAPMGANIEGLGAAAQIYFNKQAKELSLTEGLALAVMPQNPSGRFDFDREQQHARMRLSEIWGEKHPEDKALLTTLHDQPFKGRSRRSLPFLAPHFCDQILQSAPANNLQVINTTLDSRLQGLLERMLARYIKNRNRQGIVNGSLLLVDRRNMAVKALVGSADFFDQTLHGQVNGVLAKRSPGSTLKPFLYGLAIDQGLIHPQTILRDAPTAFGAYQPENFDGRFIGPISAREALIRSRNVPAIWLANQLHNPSLYGFLQSTGMTGLRSEEHYGLSLVLGGGELSMEKLVELYGLLANQGKLHPLRYRMKDPMTKGISLISPQAAFMVRNMLASNPRADGAADQYNRGNHWPIAWKTGTSWGFHDAWTVGLVGDYLLAVWIGNFDGKANPSFIGLKAATPLFFQLADALELTLADEQPSPPQPPTGLIEVEVCQASGELPNRWCPQTVKTWFIPGKSPIKVSTLHRPVMVERRSGAAACPPYDPQLTKLEVFAFWPSDLERLFCVAGLPRRSPPPLPKQCSERDSGITGDPPRVNSPLNNVIYTLRLSKPEQSIELAAAIDGESERMYWFADNLYLGSRNRGTNFSWRPPQAGIFGLSVVDDQGRSTGRTVTVEFLP